jgi:trehalose 6-phosphate synthase
MAGTEGDGRPLGNSEPRDRRPLVLVSNRGPVTFGPGGAVRRGTGGLVTALIGLATHRNVTWIASAMTDEDVLVADRHGGRPFPVEAPGGGVYNVKLVASDPDAYDRFYNITANPMLWFIQHYLWDLSNAPDIRRNETEAFEFGYNAVNEDLARAVLTEIEGVEHPVVMAHDYHLYTLPGLVRRVRPDAFLHHFVHIPWSQSDSWRVLPSMIREEIYRGILSNDIIGFHTRSYRRNFLQCCEDLFGLEVDRAAGVVRVDHREVWVRDYPLPIDSGAVQAVAERPRTKGFEEELLRRRREHLILRVDRADLSKNVLRGFTAFDVFLEQHPEFRERVTFIAQLMPSRTDVPEYAEYLERIEAVVAVVNHRHGSPDWMPIQLKLRDDLEEAVAAYKHYDVLMVNAMFDGMNLVAKEGPMVNERAGVSILSENTGAHEELGEYALSVNPFDIQELADSIHAALTMPIEERRRRHAGLRSIVTSRNPGDWIDDQLHDIDQKHTAAAARLGR